MIQCTMEELLGTIDEQSEIIMRQADRINRLSAILLQQYEVEQAEIDEGARGKEE